MAIKSLYTRVVLIFIGTVMLSLFVAFFVTSLLYRNQVENKMEDSLIASGKKIIQSYHANPSSDLVSYMEGVTGLLNNGIQLYNEQGRPMLAKTQPPIHPDSLEVKRVLAGGVARNVDDRRHLPVIGIPFQAHGQAYALFVMLKTDSLWEQINKVMNAILLIVLIVGSLLILAAARFIVKPLLRLTEATRRMATGKFDVQIRTKRKDEIGQLTASFNEMAQELAKLDRTRQDFVTNVSHEIQTPLTSISGFTKALKQKKMSEESRQHYLTIIEEESERLSRLSQNLLRLSSLQHDQQPLKVNAYRLDEQLRKAVIALEPQWAGKAIDIQLQMEPITVEADEDQLNQVWTNLLGNSIKFTPAEGRIRISAMSQEGLAVVSVTDTGIGIPAEERADIFKPFHIVDKARDRSMSGNGLGLSIVKQIVDLHHGEIKVSGAPGEGSTFTVRLPLRGAVAGGG